MNHRSRAAARLFEIPLIVAALLTIPVIAIEQSSLAEPWDTRGRPELDDLARLPR